MRVFKNRTDGLTLGLAAVVVIAMSALTACAPQSAQESPELADLAKRWTTSLNSGDVEGLVSMYSSDCRILPPNAPMAHGADGVRAVFGSMIAAGLVGETNTIEAAVAGDLGVHVGTYSIFSPDGAPVDSGKFTEVWRKTPAGWKMVSDIFNSDLPADAGKTFISFTHEVENKDHWLAAWTGPGSRKEMFAANGAGAVKVFQSPDDQNLVGLLVEVQDMDSLMAWVASPEGAKAKAEDGVIDASIRVLTEVK